MSTPIKNFNRIKDVTSLLATPYVTELVAGDQALEEIAKRLDVPNISALSGELEATRRGKTINITGSLKAKLTRICVISLEELEEYIDETFNVAYSSKPEVVEYLPGAEIEVDVDAPEPLTDSSIDLADILIEQVSLAMNPYPRIEGAVPPKDEAAPVNMSPFADLAKKVGEES